MQRFTEDTPGNQARMINVLQASFEAYCLWRIEMKRNDLASCVILTFAFLTNSAMADFVAPATLSPGDTFHWVFVTSTTGDAFDSNISTYNNRVNSAADNLPDAGNDVLGVSGVSFLRDINWFAIASTATVDARDNIGDPTSPIYRFDDALVADNEADLWDESIDNAINTTEMMTTVGERSEHVWTGTHYNGERDSLRPLGGDPDWVRHGRVVAHSGWVKYGSVHPKYGGRLYAISEELTVVPVPGAALLGFIGLATSAHVLRRRRNKAAV